MIKNVTRLPVLALVFYSIMAYQSHVIMLVVKISMHFHGKVSMEHIEEFEDTKGVIIICISKKERQHNGQEKKDRRTNNDLQNITHET